MLKIILGRGRTGKSGILAEELKNRGENTGKRQIMFVPEQYSHEAERYLAEKCGPHLSLYGEVLSFSRFALRIAERTGGFGTALDAGGKLLLMERAVRNIAPDLTLYKTAYTKPELLAELVKTSEELRTAGVKWEELAELGEAEEGTFGDKLMDFSRIFPAFDALAEQSGALAEHRLETARKRLEESGLAAECDFFMDGFTDLTAVELGLVRELLRLGADVTAAFTVDPENEENDIFASSYRTVRQLERAADEYGIKCGREVRPGPFIGNEAVSRIEKGFGDMLTRAGNEPECGGVTLAELGGITEECEYTAGSILELVHSGAARFKDIAVYARGFDRYESRLQSIFELYGIPLYVGRKVNIIQKPLPALIMGALNIPADGWSMDSVMGYVRTGLTGISREDCDLLENYLFTYNIHGREMWQGSGFSFEDPRMPDYLQERMDGVRKKLAEPVFALSEDMKKAGRAGEYARAVYAYLERAEVPKNLSYRAESLRKLGREAAEGESGQQSEENKQKAVKYEQQAEEYEQLWDIMVDILEQCDAVIGDEPMKTSEFTALLRMLISQYSVSTIPVSLDAVTAGDMTRVRRRGIKHLFIIGADDAHLPATGAGTGMLTDGEKERLSSMGIAVHNFGEERLLSEINTIYQTLILPSDTVTVTYSVSGDDGSAQRPSYVIDRTAKFTGSVITKPADVDDKRITAEIPAFELAATAPERGGDRLAASARAYFEEKGENVERLEKARNSARLERQPLSEKSAKALYGDEINMTASRSDKFARCRYEYFMEYGLKAKPLQRSAMDAQLYGTLMHYVLEKAMGEYAGVSAEELDKEAFSKRIEELVDEFAEEQLGGLRNRSERFKYLYNRLKTGIEATVRNVIDEFSVSQFRPREFELGFGTEDGLPAITYSDGTATVNIRGFADRVDTWQNNGETYFRIADYKTGKKSFNLNDVLNGLNLQMLIYLFAVQAGAGERYGGNAEAAGILYTPARELLYSGTGSETAEEIAKKLDEKLKRSGIILDDPEVIDAMESGEKKRFIPIKSRGEQDALVSAEQLGRLQRHIERTICEMGREILSGSIECNPIGNRDKNSCQYCQYGDVCRFGIHADDKPRYLRKLKTPEVWAELEKRENNAASGGEEAENNA